MNKVVLITGASSGIGKATALLLAQKDYKVYGAARRLDKMQDLRNAGIQTLEMDVTKESEVLSGIEHITKEAEGIDILINNAGFGEYGAIEDVSIEDAKYQLDVNLFGAARLIQQVIPYMRQQHWGKIVNISSIGGKIATPLGGWYHASKFALEGLSDSLRNEVKSFGIDVIVIEPGGIKTEWGTITYDNLMKSANQSNYQLLIERFAKAFRATLTKNSAPEIIANLILKAIEARKPATRYSAGYMAKPILFMRKIFTDKTIDKIIISQLRE
ncbi:SDR family NAD(P)-dependent oxidoreductase [Chitinophaga silvatica]|uniref:SDR family NAD(P)-dependent oxidoreductase n=1 Tax=Chitinophaga silvatica TaxID=2282649 RepID=A0A3E1YE54_9BACT|nr:oxidoreductase [Chitinophaga silvatica]RFS24733.1 SDR family NAD(P)-dependent oxidoreductase [Chitinophaga silvatica]